MELVFESNKRRVVREKEDIFIDIKHSGLYVIMISARCKSEKQLNSTDDEDLRIEIDGRFFGQLTNPNRYFDSPAAFAGGELHNLQENIYYFITFNAGRRTISLFPDKTATLESFKVQRVNRDDSLDTLIFKLNIEAEDGDRYPWFVFVLFNLGLSSFDISLSVKKRLIDSDDVKVIIDGKVQRNIHNTSILRRFWYFITKKDSSAIQTAKFTPQLSPGLHYIELWADRKPILHEISFANITQPKQETIEEKIVGTAKKLGLDPKLMLRIAQQESSLDPGAVSKVEAKGIYQLTGITIKQISTLGFDIADPFNPDQNIYGGMLYLMWLDKMYKGDDEELEKTLTAWNWGLSNFEKDVPLDYKLMPNETRNFIKKILGK